jgi:hypothetical protein
MSFDPKCYDLAACFLPDAAPERTINALAQLIQDTVEDWLSFERERIEAAIAKAEEQKS